MLRRTALPAVVATAIAVLVLIAGGCATTPGWQRIELPAGVRPASLGSSGDQVFVGGQVDGRPVLLRVEGMTAGRPLELDPQETAATRADLISLAVDGDDLYAVGRWFGGSHFNPRLTMWDGTATSNLLTSRPQAFFTFGGQDAGNLLGIEVVAGQPVIFGLRSETAGTEGVVWTRSGQTWTKHVRLDPSLVSNPDRVVSFTALDQSGGRLVVAGGEIGLAGGLAQQPAVWAGAPAGPWTQVRLPLPADLPQVAGQLSRATSVACADGVGCRVAGWVRGRPVVWPVEIAGSGQLTAGHATVLPGAPPQGTVPTALAAFASGRPLVLTGAGQQQLGLQLECPDGWRSLPAPAGTPTVLLSAASGLYAITGDGLLRLDPPGC